MPVTSSFTYSCNNKSVCGTPDAVGVQGLPPGWAQQQTQYVDPQGNVHNWNIVLCNVDTPKYPQTYPGISFP